MNDSDSPVQHRPEATPRGECAQTGSTWIEQRPEGDPPLCAGERVKQACRDIRSFGQWVGFGLLSLGVLTALDQLHPILTSKFVGASWGPAILRAGASLLGYGLTGWVVAASARFCAAATREFFEQQARSDARAAEFSAQSITLLERIAAALADAESLHHASTARSSGHTIALAEISRAISERRVAEAQSLLHAFAAENRDHPKVSELGQELVEAIREAASHHMAELDAAREVNDPERVIEIYQVLAPLMEHDTRVTLDRDLSRWFLSLIHRRLRSGTIQTDVVLLADRVSALFASTAEGASLRASLPTLRRSVGLCPRCGEPYAGSDDACIKCRASPSNRPTT
jgi:hypothetical protein